MPVQLEKRRTHAERHRAVAPAQYDRGSHAAAVAAVDSPLDFYRCILPTQVRRLWPEWPELNLLVALIWKYPQPNCQDRLLIVLATDAVARREIAITKAEVALARDREISI